MRKILKEAVLPPIIFNIPKVSIEATSNKPNNKQKEQYLYRQLYEYLRTLLLTGKLLPGMKLPSTRALALDAGLSRNTVNVVFEQLISEGYLQARIGAGTFVNKDMPDAFLKVHGTTDNNNNKIGLQSKFEKPHIASLKQQLSKRGNRLASIATQHNLNSKGILLPSRSDVEGFPFDIWSRLIARSWRNKGNTEYSAASLLDTVDYNGWPPLRKAIANYLNSSRGLQCCADQIIIVSGAQQAVLLTANLLIDDGESVIVEDPGFLGIRGALMGAGANIVPIATDHEGLNPKHLDVEAKLICIAPSNQYPLGGTMSASRRLALLNWSAKHNAWILEDDYDSEYRYTGKPLSALQGMDSNGRVIYFGSFSKVMFPSLRLGYLVVPKHMVNSFTCARTVLDSYTSFVAQPALAAFIEEGYFAAHLRRTRNLYHSRLSVMREEIAKHIHPDIARFSNPEAGMHACLRFDGCNIALAANDQTIAKDLNKQNIMVLPLSAFCAGQARAHGLALGFAGTKSEHIKSGILQIANTFKSYAK